MNLSDYAQTQSYIPVCLIGCRVFLSCFLRLGLCILSSLSNRSSIFQVLFLLLGCFFACFAVLGDNSNYLDPLSPPQSILFSASLLSTSSTPSTVSIRSPVHTIPFNWHSKRFLALGATFVVTSVIALFVPCGILQTLGSRLDDSFAYRNYHQRHNVRATFFSGQCQTHPSSSGWRHRQDPESAGFAAVQARGRY